MSPNLPESPSAFKVLALYKFADLADCAALQAPLARFCCARAIRGTFILAPEGINGTVAGTPQAIDELVAFLLNDPSFAGRLAGAEIKYAASAAMPFLRMKVRLKPEIVTLRAPEANPALGSGTPVEPAAWNDLLKRPDMLVIDTRNSYETRLGSFAGALDPMTESFTGFKEFVAERLAEHKDKPVAMFCTGGIRCEKASAYLLSQGFSEVFQLKGGILNYLESTPPENSLWQGECFVFDERVAVRHGLIEGEAALCRGCRQPLSQQDRSHPRFIEHVRCHRCPPDEHRLQRALQRERQSKLAETRGVAHLGQDARAVAEANRAQKYEKRQRDREQALARR